MIVHNYPKIASELTSLRLRLHDVGEVESGQKWNWKHVCSPFHRLYFIADGDPCVTSKGVAYLMKPGSIWLIPANCTADYTCREKVVKGFLNFNLEWLPGLDCLAHNDTPSFIDKWKPSANHPFWPVRAKIGEPHFIPQIISEVFRLIALLPAPAPIPNSQITLDIAPTLRWLEMEINANLKINQLAKHAGLSRSGLTKKWHTLFGIHPKAFVDRQLLNNVKTSLLLTNNPIHRIADQYRFSSEFHFSRWFKRHTSVSPNTFRLRNQLPFNSL